MRLDLGLSLDALRAQALARIDARARDAMEAIRPSWLAPVDALRAEQARATPRAGQAADEAAAVLAAKQATDQALLRIDAWRRAAKSAIRAAPTPRHIRQLAEQPIDTDAGG
jgi:hypothetical protein